MVSFAQKCFDSSILLCLHVSALRTGLWVREGVTTAVKRCEVKRTSLKTDVIHRARSQKHTHTHTHTHTQTHTRTQPHSHHHTHTPTLTLTLTLTRTHTNSHSHTDAHTHTHTGLSSIGCAHSCSVLF